MTNTTIRIIIIAVLSVTILTAAETSVSLNRAMEIVSSARNAVSSLPVLAGTEGFDVEAFRQTLRDLRGDTPYTAYLTAQNVVDLVGGASTAAEQLVAFDIGWAALEVNWFYATLLGNTDSATSLLAESRSLIGQQSWYFSNILEGSRVVFANYFPKPEANGLAMALRRSAADINVAMYIPDAIDPEGFLRQRLRGVFNRLTNSADFIRDAGEAYTYSYY